MNLHINVRWTLAVAACVALAACSGEPSNADIRHALEKNFEASAAAVQKMTGAMSGAMGAQQAAALASKMPQWKVNEVKKIGCKADGKAYLCDVDSDIEVPFAGRIQRVMPMRLIKASDGWQITGGF